VSVDTKKNNERVCHGQYERNPYLIGGKGEAHPFSLFLPCFELLLWWECHI
jgi:hypothetical protein